jgi:Flp pilus assembly protein TadG
VLRLVRRLTARGPLRRFVRRQDGTAAIEFALVAAPFFALLFAIIETALVFFAGQALETAVSNAARLIRTGQAQSAGYTVADFKSKICDQISALFDCTGKLQLNVTTSSTFGGIDLTTPLDKDGNLDASKFGYTPGHGNDIVVVRAYYEWPVFVKLLGLNLSNMTDGNHLLTATAAFRNEPFTW